MTGTKHAIVPGYDTIGLGINVFTDKPLGDYTRSQLFTNLSSDDSDLDAVIPATFARVIKSPAGWAQGRGCQQKYAA